jgi:hypothetical protein
MKVLSLLAALLLTFPNLRALPQAVATPQRDSQALTILNQALAAAGGVSTIATIQDVTGTGSIAYNWAGQQVQGAVTLRQLGSNSFRLDAGLTNGTRSWAVSYGAGSVREVDGTSHPIGLADAVNLGALCFPLAEIYADTQDSSTTLIYVGATTIVGRTAFQIHIQRNYSAQIDPNGILSQARARDFFIDAANLQILKIQDFTHPGDKFQEPYTHEITFSNYTVVGGLLIPFALGESIAGQQTWTIQLSSVTFNTGLTDSDFQL